ncbi:hypothetical protein HanXRQr2_Chr03g0134451 [Helianthus annuus]|uniref:Uncharacterized protein n=1 Tax=Helianthus annuus TaxID=4232 RepID=A0A9K3JJY8_HELAN|nr:hypothetical protein HanXRQr2_Chr03g0134451 [Helianthus annuus]
MDENDQKWKRREPREEKRTIWTKVTFWAKPQGLKWQLTLLVIYKRFILCTPICPLSMPPLNKIKRVCETNLITLGRCYL